MTLIDFLKRLYRLKEARKWEREARKALRSYETHRAEIALARARELNEQ